MGKIYLKIIVRNQTFWKNQIVKFQICGKIANVNLWTSPKHGITPLGTRKTHFTFFPLLLGSVPHPYKGKTYIHYCWSMLTKRLVPQDSMTYEACIGIKVVLLFRVRQDSFTQNYKIIWNTLGTLCSLISSKKEMKTCWTIVYQYKYLKQIKLYKFDLTK